MYLARQTRPCTKLHYTHLHRLAYTFGVTSLLMVLAKLLS